MFGARKKSSAKLTKNQSFSLVFHNFLLSPSQPHLRPPLISPPSLPPQPSSQPNTPTTLRGVCTTSPSLSLLYEKLFPLRHRDSNSSSDHPFQRFLPIPAAVEAATFSSSAPTASDRSTVRDSSNTCNSAAATPAAQLSTIATACTTSSSSVRPPLRQVTLRFLFLPPLLVPPPYCSLREQWA